jgi:hypothetical protein
MNKYSPLLFVMIFSFLFGDANVQIRLQNGQKAQGEFVGTYMNHVHILVEEKIIYYACDDIISITYADGGFSYGKGYDYDCSKNTVTADILFPPQLDPMTGEMTQMLPDVFNPDIPKPAVKVEAGGISTEQDFVVIDGVKYTRELIKDQNDTAEIEIWNKKIPPSVYFEKLSNDLERPSRLSSCFTSYLSFGFGLLFLQGTTDEDGYPGIGYGMGTISIAGGLYYASRILRIGPKGLKWITKTDEGKQFENIKNIQDKNEKEKLAYESLVALAPISRIKKNERIDALYEELPDIDSLTNIQKQFRPSIDARIDKMRIQMTIEEKALDDYLNQIPIGITDK